MHILLTRTSPNQFEPNSGGLGGVEEEGEFEWSGLSAGTYLLEVKGSGDARAPTLLRREGIAIQAGRTLDLGDLEVPVTGRKISVRLVAPDGGPVPVGSYGASVAPEAWALKQIAGMDPFKNKDLWRTKFRDQLENGLFSTVTTERIVMFEAAVPGYRYVHIENIPWDRTVELKPGLPVMLKLKKRVGAPLEGCTFRIGLVSKGEPPLDPCMAALYRSEPFAADGTAILYAPDPGTYWIQWIVERAAQGSSVARTVNDNRQQLEILELGTGQFFELVPPLDPSRVDPSRQ
jgi:hypothetical protein